MNKSTLVALRRFMFSASMENGVDAAHALDAEIAAIEAEARGGAYVPKVGDVVAGTWSNKPDSYGATLYRLASPPGDGPHWTCVRVDGRERVRECYIAADNFRPATPSERIAAGLDKAPTEARQACPMCNKPLGVKSATDATPYQRMLDSLTCECGEHDDESPAPPPARPKRVRARDGLATMGSFTIGKSYDVYGFDSEMECVYFIGDDERTHYFAKGEWVPADEPEGEDYAKWNDEARAAFYAIKGRGPETIGEAFINGYVLARAKAGAS